MFFPVFRVKMALLCVVSSKRSNILPFKEQLIFDSVTRDGIAFLTVQKTLLLLLFQDIRHCNRNISARCDVDVNTGRLGES